MGKTVKVKGEEKEEEGVWRFVLVNEVGERGREMPMEITAITAKHSTPKIYMSKRQDNRRGERGGARGGRGGGVPPPQELAILASVRATLTYLVSTIPLFVT